MDVFIYIVNLHKIYKNMPYNFDDKAKITRLWFKRMKSLRAEIIADSDKFSCFYF